MKKNLLVIFLFCFLKKRKKLGILGSYKKCNYSFANGKESWINKVPKVFKLVSSVNLPRLSSIYFLAWQKKEALHHDQRGLWATRTHTRTNVQMQTYASASASSAQDMHNKNTFEGREEPKKRERQVLTLELHVLNRARTPGGVRGQRRRFSSRTASLVAFYCFCVPEMSHSPLLFVHHH